MRETPAEKELREERERQGIDLARIVEPSFDLGAEFAEEISQTESAESFFPASRDWHPGGLRETVSEPAPTLPFALLSTALANVPDEPLWAWDGYLAPGAITLLAGRPKVGKSTLLCALIDALAHGRTFLDRSTRSIGVLMLSEEREGTLAEKARRWKLNGSIHVLMRHQAHGREWSQVVAEAVAYCEMHNLGVLVVDTFDKWCGLRGDAENNAGSVLEVLEPLQRAAGAGLVVVIVAHQRKSLGDFGEAVRGSNALTGTVDIVAELERPRSDVLASDGVRVLHAVSRYSGTPDELVIALTESGYEARGDTLTATADAERDRVFSLLEDLGEAPLAKLIEETELADSTLRRYLKRLLADELVIRRGTGKRGDPFVYCHHAHSLGGKETPLLDEPTVEPCPGVDEIEVERIARMFEETSE